MAVHLEVEGKWNSKSIRSLGQCHRLTRFFGCDSPVKTHQIPPGFDHQHSWDLWLIKSHKHSWELVDQPLGFVCLSFLSWMSTVQPIGGVCVEPIFRPTSSVLGSYHGVSTCIHHGLLWINIGEQDPNKLCSYSVLVVLVSYCS